MSERKVLPYPSTQTARRRHAIKRGAREEQMGARESPDYIVEMGEAAERAVHEFLGIEFKDTMGRDKGWDLIWRGWRIDVKWSGELRRCFLVPADRPLKADLYLLVTGRDKSRLTLEGWAYRHVIEQSPTEVLSKTGRPSYCYDPAMLHPPGTLFLRSKKVNIKRRS